MTSSLGSLIYKVVKMLRRLSYAVPSFVIWKLYTTVVLPSLDYCDIVWAGCSKSAANRLEVV